MKTLDLYLTSVIALCGLLGFSAAARNTFIEDTEGLDIPMVFIDQTTFMMGGTDEHASDREDDETVHQVTVSPFYIAATEITQSQWKKVMGTTLEDMYHKTAPDHDFGRYGVGEDKPMYYVSWHDAVDFCRKLSALTGLSYRLPTEAEWELAARGGESAAGKYSGSDELDAVGWYVDNADMDRFNKGNPECHPVAGKLPNALGLYDMSGNICEWCSCLYSPYPTEPTTDPQGREYNGDRVYRGGSFRSSSNYCRTAFRNSNSPAFASEAIGFRVVLEP